jgi:thiol:disulfide interchange protein DsbA
VKVKAADDLVRAYQVDSTPTLIVNGKWKLNNQSIESIDQIVELVKFLVAKESAPATS